MKRLASMFCLFMLVFAVSAATYEWVGGDGDWTTTTMWSPEGPVVTTDDVSINEDGDYTVDINVGGDIANDIEVGTTSSTGTQTLNVDTWSAPKFANLTIGPNGVFIQSNKNIGSVSSGSDIIQVQSNGLFQFTGSRDLGGHNLIVDQGGTVEVNGVGQNLNVVANSDVTINGLVTGVGNIKATGNEIEWYGDGTIAGDGGFVLSDDVQAREHKFYGSLTLDRDVYQYGPTLLDDDVMLEINGIFYQTNGSRSFGALNEGAMPTVSGDGDINVVITSDSSTVLRLGGAGNNNNSNGGFRFEGDGELNFDVQGDGYVWLSATNLFVNRPCTMKCGDNGGYFLIGYNNYGIFTYTSTNTITFDNALIKSENRSYMDRYMILNGGATVVIKDGTCYEGRTSNTTNGKEDFQIGPDSGATLIIEDNANCSIRTLGDDNDKKNVRIRLYEKASTIAGENSVLNLENADMRIDMTNSADWGWNENITINFTERTSDPNVDSTGKFEALSTDLGVSPSLSDIMLLNAMSFSTTNMTFELMENTDNDSDGTPDTVVYTRTLDFSELSEGSITMTGLSGDEKVYYSELINPNGITFDSSKWVQAALPTGRGTVLIVQ